MLQLRNTLDSDYQVSPAEIMYGRHLQDGFAFLNKLDTFSNPAARPVWREACKLKEEALHTRFVKNPETITIKLGSCHLCMLVVGFYCRIRAAPIRVNEAGVEW